MVAVCVAADSPPYGIYDSRKGVYNLQADFWDYDAYYLAKTYHHLKFDPDELLLDRKWYIGILNSNLITGGTSEISYNLSYIADNQPVCPRNWWNHGNCRQTGECSCDVNYVSSDWSLQATRIFIDEASTISVETGKTKYMYMYLNSIDESSVEVDVDWRGGDPVISHKNSNSGNAEIASIYENEQSWHIGPDGEYSFSITVDVDSSKYWYIQIINQSSSVRENLIITLKPTTTSSETESLLIYILLAVASSIILLWIVLAILKSRVRRVAPIRNVLSMGPAEPESQGIPQDKVEQLFPAMTFEAIPDQAENECCSVCLEPFDKISEVRQLYCQHVYHVKCIDIWFERNTSCCLCKRNYANAGDSALEDETDITETVPPSANVSFIGADFLESQENEIQDSQAALIEENSELISEEPLHRQPNQNMLFAAPISSPSERLHTEYNDDDSN